MQFTIEPVGAAFQWALLADSPTTCAPAPVLLRSSRLYRTLGECRLGIEGFQYAVTNLVVPRGATS